MECKDLLHVDQEILLPPKTYKTCKAKVELGVFKPIQALPFSGVMALFRHAFAELLKIKVISFPNCLLSGRGLKQPACGLHKAC